ncbi:type II secretion system GspH family protein [bacterium]|nr:type II secretion system GspH family protein [bacterium]
MKKDFSQGLTLIELMAVVTMIIIVTGVVFATYGIGRDSLALDRSSQKLYQDLRFALANSMSGIDGATGAGIHFDKSGSTTSYLIFKNPTSSTSQTFDTDSLNIYASRGVLISDWIKLEDGVKIISFKNISGGTSDNSLNVYFRSPYPTTFLNGIYYQNKTNCVPQSDCTVSIVIGTNDGSKTKTITINNSGMIDLK